VSTLFWKYVCFGAGLQDPGHVNKIAPVSRQLS
jgi:hypothetical protein